MGRTALRKLQDLREGFDIVELKQYVHRSKIRITGKDRGAAFDQGAGYSILVNGCLPASPKIIVFFWPKYGPPQLKELPTKDVCLAAADTSVQQDQNIIGPTLQGPIGYFELDASCMQPAD